MSLSSRAQKALDILKDGGLMANVLERNGYTGRAQFKTSFYDKNYNIIKGLSAKTRYELEDAGFNFSVYNSTSVGSYYKICL